MSERMLTDADLRKALRSPGPKEYLLNDGGSLFARVRPTADPRAASVAWQWVYRFGGKLHRLHLGSYPDVTLKDARERRDRYRRHLSADPPRNPAEVQREGRATEVAAAAERARAHLTEQRRLTVRQLFDDWHAHYLTHERKDAGASAAALMALHVFPDLGAMKAERVEAADITRVLNRLVAADKRRTANVALATMKQLFDYAVVRGYLRASPAAAFRKRHAGGTEASRERVLAADELRLLAAKLPASGLTEAQQAAVRFLLATGCRIGEFMRARWHDLDRERSTWTVPAEHSKNGQEHVVHLSAFAWQQLNLLERYITGPWLMPSTRIVDGQPLPPDEKALTKMIRDRQREAQQVYRGRTTRQAQALLLPGGVWVPHDLRRTMATHLGELGVAPWVVEKCLNHLMQGVMAVYNRQRYEADQREAFDKWGRFLAEQMRPAEGEPVVVPELAAAARPRRGGRRG